MREPFRKAQVYITTLLVIEVILGVMIMVTTGIYHYVLGTYLAETERKMLNGQLFNTYLLGFQLIATYLGSIFMWNSLWIRRSSPNICLLLSVWMFFTLLIMLSACATICSLFFCATALHMTAENSLLKGIDMYYSCPEWKLHWDGLQFYHECCGVHSYMDWMKASWMPNDDGSNEQRAPTESCTDRKTTVMAPYACCKHTCNACYENYIPRSGSFAIPYLNLNQINTGGCLPQFEESLWDAISLLVLFVASTILIDVVMVCLTKIIITSQNCDMFGHQAFDDDLDDDGIDHPLLDYGPDGFDGERSLHKPSSHRKMGMYNSRNNFSTNERKLTARDSIDCESEHRACLEAKRRAEIRSNLDAEVERRANMRARIEEDIQLRSSKLKTQRGGSPGLGKDSGRDSPNRPPERRQEGGFAGITCSTCTHSRKYDSESRFVH